MAINENLLRRSRERRFFLLAAILFPLIVLIGFARTYYLKVFFATPPLASILVHLHGGVMTAWVALFIAQIWLIRSKNVRLHQTIGFAGIALAILVVIVSFFTAVTAAKYGAMSSPPDIPRLAFLIVPIFDLVVFVMLFGAAVYHRKHPVEHKRLMFLTALNFLPPAVARIPSLTLQSLGPLWFFGFPGVIALAVLIADTWYHRKLNKVFLAGTLALIASYPLRLMLGGTETWMGIAAWLTNFAVY